MTNSSQTKTLRQIALFLANLAEKSEDVYWLSSPGFQTLEYVSPAYEKIWGRSLSELFARPSLWVESMHPEDFEKYHPIIASTRDETQLEPDVRYNESYRIIRPDGEIRWIIDRGFPVFTPKGEYCGIMGIAMDVSKDKMAYERLRAAYEIAETANRTKSEFIANVSHDIRTPFAGICELAKYLAKKENDPSKKEELGYIVESSERLLEFLTEVIDFSQLESGTRAVVREKFDIKELIDSILGMMRAQAMQKKIELRTNLPHDFPTLIEGDYSRIQRILLNLVGNAVKFTETGYVKIEARIIGRDSHRLMLELTVEDSGIGIPQDKLNYIFRPYTRLKTTHRNNISGMGMGLPIAQKFAEEMGGKLEVESVAGKGSKFFFTLPLMIPAEEMEEKHEAPHTVATNPVYKVLLVDDDKLVQVFIRNIISSLGHEVNVANDATEAKHFLTRDNYDIILMDLELPGQDGISLAYDLKSYCKSTIIAVTSHQSKEHEQKCYDAGMKAIIHKPLTADKFKKIVDELNSTS